MIYVIRKIRRLSWNECTKKTSPHVWYWLVVGKLTSGSPERTRPRHLLQREFEGTIKTSNHQQNHHLSACFFPFCLLAGGLEYFSFLPRSLGKWSNLTRIFFRWVVQPPTSLLSDMKPEAFSFSMGAVFRWRPNFARKAMDYYPAGPPQGWWWGHGGVQRGWYRVYWFIHWYSLVSWGNLGHFLVPNFGCYFFFAIYLRVHGIIYVPITPWEWRYFSCLLTSKRDAYFMVIPWFPSGDCKHGFHNPPLDSLDS